MRASIDYGPEIRIFQGQLLDITDKCVHHHIAEKIKKQHSDTVEVYESNREVQEYFLVKFLVP